MLYIASERGRESGRLPLNSSDWHCAVRKFFAVQFAVQNANTLTAVRSDLLTQERAFSKFRFSLKVTLFARS